MEMFSEVVAIFRRWNTKLLRQPIFLFFSLIQPLVWFLLFTQAFSAIGSIQTPQFSFASLTGTSSYITFFTAAVIIQTIASSALQAGIGIVNDLDSGFMDKMRVAPIRKSAILFGKLFSDAISTIIQVVIILVIGLALGVHIASGILGAIMILFIAATFGIAWYLSIRCPDHEEQSDHAVNWATDNISIALLICERNAASVAAQLGAASGQG
jgi:ABC-2 type transport system permease protein